LGDNEKLETETVKTPLIKMSGQVFFTSGVFPEVQSGHQIIALHLS
jgi:hypothetical protein